MSESIQTTVEPADAPPRPRTAVNVLWLLVEKVLKAVGSVGVGIIIARHLGPGEYGRYGAAIGLATLAKETVMLGFDRMIRRDLAARPRDAEKIIGTSIALALAVAFAVVLGLTAASHRLADDETTRRLMLIVIWMALPQAFFACEIWFESAGQIRTLVWTRNVVWLLALAGRLALVFIDASVTAFAILALAEWVLTYATVCWQLGRVHRSRLRFAFSGYQLRVWFREGWPMLVMAAFNSGADRVMVLLVQNLSPSSAEAGYLNAAARITDIWWSISTIVASVLLPRIVFMQMSDRSRFMKATQTYADASLLGSVVVALLVTVQAPFLVPALFGAAYTPSAIVLIILVWSGPAVFPSVARSQFWVTGGQQVLDMPSVISTAILQLGLAVWLIPRHGAIGAALAMTLARWLGFYGVSALVPPLRRASLAPFHAFRALLAPRRTIVALAAFGSGMLGRHRPAPPA